MKLLLKEDVENLGNCGDEVEVRDEGDLGTVLKAIKRWSAAR